MPTARRLGGPTLITHDFTAQGAPYHGVIASYHLFTDAINQLIDQIRANEANTIGLSPWLLTGAADGVFIDWEGTGGKLTPQMETNLVNLLARFKSAGFQYILVAPQFWGDHDLRQPGFTKCDDNFAFLCDVLRPMLDANGVPYLIDLCTEGIGDTRGTCQSYCQTIWDEYTARFWPNGLVCWDATISVVPTTTNVVAMADWFQGNWPGIFNFHAYSDQQGHLLPVLQRIQSALKAVSAPLRAWLLGETDTLVSDADETVVTQLAYFANQMNGQTPVEGVVSWPVHVQTAEGIQIDLVPTMRERWRDWGI